MPGQLSHIAVGSDGAVYGIDSSGGAFWYNPGTGYFQYLGAPALSQIAVGADGLLMGISDGLAYTYKRGALQPVVEDFAAAQVAFGTGARVYALDASGNIYYANGQTESWNQIPGTLSSIAFGGNGAVWGINGAQEIFTLQNAPMCGFQTLTSVSGSANQISVGADGSVWALSGTTVETFNPTSQSLEAVSGAPALAQISLGASGKIWGLDASGNIYQWDASSATFTNVPGQLTFIQAAANGSVWGINAAGQIYTYSNNSWTNIPGTLASLSVGADGTVWGINAQQQIYRFDGQSWVNVPGSLVQIRARCFRGSEARTNGGQQYRLERLRQERGFCYALEWWRR